MHYSVLVIVPSVGSPEEMVGRLLAPYQEEVGGQWDWFQIGGRWTGMLDGYDPSKDPANWRTCDLCDGTGTRTVPTGDPDFKPEPGRCNGCQTVVGNNEDGTYKLGPQVEGQPGMRVEWPTGWPTHPGDVMGVADVLEKWDGEKHTPFAIVTPDGEWHARESWDGVEFVERPGDWPAFVREQLEMYPNRRVVVVDCHS
jgi:hypothetical protein